MKNRIDYLMMAIALALLFSATALATSVGTTLPKAPTNIQDTESLQRGAQLFTNYCLSCHSASAMRYNRLTEIGLTEEQIKEYLLPEGAKIGDQMNVVMNRKDAQAWFGATPPDLSLIARSRGADYLYGYLRGFYRDARQPTGWNNVLFDKVGMPHIFWQWQGEQVLTIEKNPGLHEEKKLKLIKPGTMTKLINGEASTVEFDKRMADLTNFLVYLADPGQVRRHQIGYLVLMFLSLLLLPLAYFMKKEYWRDVH